MKKPRVGRSKAEKTVIDLAASGLSEGVIEVRGKTLPRNLSLLNGRVKTLTVYGANLVDLSPLRELSSLKELSLIAPKITDLSAICELTNIKGLLFETPAVINWSFLSNFKDLWDLTINSSLHFTGREMKGFKSLKEVQISYCPCFKSLEPLREAHEIEILDISATGVTNISLLKHMQRLRKLRLDDTDIQSVSVCSNFKYLQELTINSCRKIKNINSLADCVQIQSLNVAFSGVSDISVIKNLRNLEVLSVSSTLVSDLSAAENLRLKQLYAASCMISDLSPLRSCSLEYLMIEGSEVSDLSPISNMISLADAAAQNNGRYAHVGLEFRGFRDYQWSQPLSSVAKLPQPYRTVEALNIVRRQSGRAEYWPADYVRPEHIEKILSGEYPIEDPDDWQVKERPATFDFSVKSGRLEAAAARGQISREDLAHDIYKEVLEKSEATKDRLSKTQASSSIIDDIARLQITLGVNLEDVRPGLLLMRFRGVESAFNAYDNPEGRRELSEDAFSTLADLLSSLEDLMTCFPQIAKLQAERLALSVQEMDVPQIMALMQTIADEASEFPVVADSSRAALQYASDMIRSSNDIIASNTSRQDERSAAIRSRAKLVSQKLLDYNNFSARVIREAEKKAPGFVRGEANDFAWETWQSIKGHVPEAIGRGLGSVSEATIKFGFLALAAKISGPLLGISALVRLFGPIGKSAKRLSERTPPTADKPGPKTRGRKRQPGSV